MIVLIYLKEAWHKISVDPLVDSDEETGGDEYVREDYGRTLPMKSWEHLN